MNKSISQNLSYGFFLFVLIFTPLAFGTVENWSFTVLETATAFSFLLLFIPQFIKKLKILEIPGALPFLLLLGLILLQLLPLPASLISYIAPSTFEIYRPLLELDPSNTFISLSVNRKSTLLTFFTFASYGLFYILTVHHLSSADRLKRTTAIVTVLGSVVALEAIIQKLTSPDTIFWLRDAPSNASPVGPWVYSNHFAGYMEMIFPLVIALFLFYRPQVHYDTKLKDRIITLFTMPGANRYLLLATGAVLIAISILLSLSRGGIVTLCLAFLFFTIFSSRITNDRRTHWAVLITVSVVLMITWLGWQPIVDKFGHIWGAEGLNTSGRLPVYRDTLEIIREFPIFGTGAGTFVHVYPAFRTVFGESIFDHTHNDYLELISECGVLGFLLMGWFVLTVFFHTIKRLFRRRDRYSILITSGALTGMLAMLFHCLVDFQLSNGANGLFFFFLCGLAVSGANTRLQFRSRPTLLGEIHSPKYILIPGFIAILLFTGSSLSRVGIIMAQKTYAPLRSIYVNPNIPTAGLEHMHEVTVNASKHDPLEPFYLFRLGNFSTLLNKQQMAQNEYLSACLLNPMSGAFIQQLGIAMPREELTRKNDLLALGIEREPLLINGYLIYSEWLLKIIQQNRAFEVLKDAIETIPQRMEDIARYIRNRAFSDDEIAEILPPLPFAWHAMGRTFENSGQSEAAKSYYLKTLDFLDSDDIQPDYFIRLYSLYRKQKEDDKALGIIRLGIETLPEEPWFRIQLGNYYLSQEIEYRAVEEFRTALKLDPDNRMLAKKLREIEQQ